MCNVSARQWHGTLMTTTFWCLLRQTLQSTFWAGVLAFQLLCLWSNDTHKHWPRLFKAVVRELLVGWQARHTREGAPQPVADTDAALFKTLQHLHGLRLSVLMNIFQKMAEPTGFWGETGPPSGCQDVAGWMIGEQSL